MAANDHASSDSPDNQLPRHTTPTWEVELLISGVAVFAMLQLPGWLNDRLLFLQPRFDERWRMPLEAIFIYGTTAAVILAITFALHLLMRAYWIALVGMHSVYPDGIRWDRLRMGPVERAVMQRRHGSLAEMIERADNRASIVFAVGVMLASNLLVVSVLIVGLFTLAMSVVALAGLPIRADHVFFACALAITLPLLLLNLLDRKLGDHLREGNLLRRVMAAGFRAYLAVGLNNQGGVIGVLSSHHGRRRVQVFTILAMFACIGVATLGLIAVRAPGRLGNYGWFPRFDKSGASIIDAAHYDDQRDPLHDPATPFIQSTEIDGNYLRLAVPYKPDDDALAMQRKCASTPAIADVDVRADALLRCLAALHPVTLDGKPLPGLRYDAGSDARSERPALVAMIDVRALKPGRHELAIARAPSVSDSGKPRPSDPWLIPFWR